MYNLSLKNNFIYKRNVKIYANKPVFSLYSKFMNISIKDLQNIEKTCNYIEPINRKECFLSFGIDYDNFIKYYDFVIKIEKIYKN